jgi:hypothetical protein
MSKSDGRDHAEVRLALAEKAIAQMTVQIDELSAALAQVAQLKDLEARESTREIVIGAEAISPFTTGFHQCEYDQANRPYRWTGRGKYFEFRFRINRNIEWTFAIELQRNSHVNTSGLCGSVDYIEVPLEVRGNGKFIVGTIPRKTFSNVAVLTFYLPSTFVPKLVDPATTDVRTLGLIFYELKVTPKKSFVGAAPQAGLVNAKKKIAGRYPRLWALLRRIRRRLPTSATSNGRKLLEARRESRIP